jgi:hypothetical protein
MMEEAGLVEEETSGYPWENSNVACWEIPDQNDYIYNYIHTYIHPYIHTIPYHTIPVSVSCIMYHIS